MNENDISNNISFSFNRGSSVQSGISLNAIIPSISYEITQTPPPVNWVNIHSAAMVTGITAAAIAYSTVKATGTVAATAAEYGTFAVGSIITEGIRAVLGDIPAAISNSATRTTSYIVTNGISAAASTSAIIAGATAGAIATGTTLASGFILDAIHSSINSALQYVTSSQPKQNTQLDMSFIIYDLSNNLLCYEVEEVPKSTVQNNNYGRNISETPTMDGIQMVDENTNIIYNNTANTASSPNGANTTISTSISAIN
jgi:hypothetical protein